MRRRYWSFFNRAKYSVFYYERYQEHCKFILRAIKIVLALVSCGSIAAWAIWTQFPAAWAFILACAQVASILQTNLPYSKDIIHHRHPKVLTNNRMRKPIASSSFVIAPKYRLHQT